MIKYYEKTHRYKDTDTNVWLPSVNKILDDLSIKPKYRESSLWVAQRGTDIHRSIACAIKGELAVKEEHEVVAEWAVEIVNNSVDVVGDVKVETIISRNDYDYSYAGTADCIINDYVVIEWKSGKPHEWHKLQCGLYGMTLKYEFAEAIIAYVDHKEIVSIDFDSQNGRNIMSDCKQLLRAYDTTLQYRDKK